MHAHCDGWSANVPGIEYRTVIIGMNISTSCFAVQVSVVYTCTHTTSGCVGGAETEPCSQPHPLEHIVKSCDYDVIVCRYVLH